MPAPLEYTRPPLVEPGQVAQAVGLFDPVGTGDPVKHHDRRLPPSVISGIQITAADERRGLFKSDRIVDPGMTPDGRFLLGHEYAAVATLADAFKEFIPTDPRARGIFFFSVVIIAGEVDFRHGQIVKKSAGLIVSAQQVFHPSPQRRVSAARAPQELHAHGRFQRQGVGENRFLGFHWQMETGVASLKCAKI